MDMTNDHVKEFATACHEMIWYALDRGLKLPLRITIASHDGSRMNFQVVDDRRQRPYKVVAARRSEWELVFPVNIRMED